MRPSTGLPILADLKATLKEWQGRLHAIIGFKEDHSMYSLEETLTGEAWIGGEPIFRKVFNVGPWPNATEKLIPHGIRYRRVIRIEGYATDGNFIVPIVFADVTGAANNFTIYLDPTNIHISAGLNRTTWTDSYVILEYTKS